MPRYESETFAEFKQESLQIVQQRLFEVGFQQFSGAGQSQEFQHNRIADKLARILLQRCDMRGSLLFDRPTVRTRKQALIDATLEQILHFKFPPRVEVSFRGSGYSFDQLQKDETFTLRRGL